VLVILEHSKRYVAKMKYMPSLSRRALYQINQRAHGKQSKTVQCIHVLTNFSISASTHETKQVVQPMTV
jgi:rRNA processing protein Krr1/Pno1